MKILVVGAKKFGQMHLSAIKDMEISIVERDENAVRNASSIAKINKVYTSIDDALKDKYDIVDIIVPHYLHHEFAIKAMKAGSNVLMEKPIATDINEAREIIEASKKYGVKFMVTDQYYFDPAVNKAMELINDNKIGKINTIIVRDQRYYDHTGWRTDKDKMGGGALIDGGIHFINVLRHFGGDIKSVYGNSIHAGSTLSGEDTTRALVEFNSGAFGLFFYSWAYKEPPEVPGFEIIGSNGSIYEDPAGRSSWDIGTPDRTVFGDLVMNGKKVDFRKYDVYEREISEFKKAVENNLDVPFPPEMALHDLEIVKKIYSNKNSM